MNESKPRWLLWLSVMLVVLGLASVARAVHDFVSVAPQDQVVFDLFGPWLGWLWQPMAWIVRFQRPVAVINILAGSALTLAGGFMLSRRSWSRAVAETCFWYWLSVNVVLSIYFVAIWVESLANDVVTGVITNQLSRNVGHLAVYVLFIHVLRRTGVRHAFEVRRQVPAEA